MTVPDLSVVIISWRMKDLLSRLLASVYRETKTVTFEVIVVDNGSDDGTNEMVRTGYPDVRLLENAENKGVAAARNQGFRICRGRYLMTLDADTYLTGDALGRLVRFMDREASAGIAGPKLTFPDGTVQPSARRFPTPAAQLLRRMEGFAFVRDSAILRRHEMADWDRSDSRPVDYVIGACQIIRRPVYEAIGELDEAIFYGPEDVDYCLRAQLAGWRVWFVADATIVHLEQRITKRRLLSLLSVRHLAGIFHLYWKYGGRLSVPPPERGPAQ